MVRTTTRRGKRVLVIDFTYTKPDGTQGRYRRAAAVQTTAAAKTEDAARTMGATLHGNPEILCGANGQPLKAVEPTPKAGPPKEPTFSEVVDRYFADYAPSALSPSTLDDYAGRLRGRFVPRVGDLAVSEAFDVARSREIDVAMIAAGLSAAARRNAFLALRSVAKFAVEAKIVRQAPAFLPLPKRGKRVSSAPSACDVALLIDAARCPAHRLLFLLAAHAGLRKGRNQGAPVRGRRVGVQPLGRAALPMAEPHEADQVGARARGTPDAPTAGGSARGGGGQAPPRRVRVAGAVRQPWTSSGPYAALQRTLRRLELPRERLHAPRAFFVTTLLNGHVPPHVVRELVGHGDLATTQGYAAIVASDRGAAVGALDRAYQAARSPQAERPRAKEGPLGRRRRRATRRRAARSEKPRTVAEVAA
jgi:integrase